MPGADHAGVIPVDHQTALVQRPAQVGALVREHVDGLAGPYREQAEVAELASGGPPVGQFGQRAEILPADRGQVPDRLGVARSGPQPHRQVTAEIAADGGGGEPARRQRGAAAAPPGRPGEQRAREQQGRAGLGDRVHQPDPLLMGVQRRPVGEAAGGGRQRRRHARRDQRGRRPLGLASASAPAEPVEQHGRGPAADRQPDQRPGGPAGRTGRRAAGRPPCWAAAPAPRLWKERGPARRGR